jgi:hypothetical protein
MSEMNWIHAYLEILHKQQLLYNELEHMYMSSLYCSIVTGQVHSINLINN